MSEQNFRSVHLIRRNDECSDTKGGEPMETSDTTALTCWKDIANYLGKGVRTVQRWEQEFGLPVRRPNGISHKSPVAADPRDLDAWLQSRWSVRAQRSEDRAVVRAPGDREPRVREGILRDIRDNAHQWSELQARLQRVRHEHQELVREVAAAISSLNQTCQLMASQRKSSNS
jgi:hypothetical protein